MEIPILDKGIDDWGNDEQEEAYDKLQQLKQDFEGTPTKLYINNNEELQSYMMWFARMDGLPYEMTDGETRVCQSYYFKFVWVLLFYYGYVI